MILSIYLISLTPWIDARAVTTFTDQGAGGAGGQAVGRVYDLYGNLNEIISYPVPNYVFADVLLLRIGHWQFNVIGLYVVLLLVAPFILWVLRRHLAWVVLAASWGIYLLSSIHPIRIFCHAAEECLRSGGGSGRHGTPSPGTRGPGRDHRCTHRRRTARGRAEPAGRGTGGGLAVGGVSWGLMCGGTRTGQSPAAVMAVIWSTASLRPGGDSVDRGARRSAH